MAGEYETYYAIVRGIPSGRVMTYGDVAHYAGRRRHARRVGYALAALRDESVPWWRVVNAEGGVSARARDGRPDPVQRARLEAEGIEFDLAGRLDLDRYRLRPGDDDAFVDIDAIPPKSPLV
ncbi:MAG: MGMT family protein [Alphaproteobacteria bacterium]